MRYLLYYIIDNLKQETKDLLYFEEGELVLDNNTTKEFIRIKKTKSSEEKNKLLNEYFEKKIPDISLMISGLSLSSTYKSNYTPIEFILPILLSVGKFGLFFSIQNVLINPATYKKKVISYSLRHAELNLSHVSDK